jgi:hypothetical protein
MLIKSKVSWTSKLAALLVFAGVLPCFAQDGKLAIHVYA